MLSQGDDSWWFPGSHQSSDFLRCFWSWSHPNMVTFPWISHEIIIVAEKSHRVPYECITINWWIWSTIFYSHDPYINIPWIPIHSYESPMNASQIIWKSHKNPAKLQISPHRLLRTPKGGDTTSVVRHRLRSAAKICQRPGRVVVRDFQTPHHLGRCWSFTGHGEFQWCSRRKWLTWRKTDEPPNKEMLTPLLTFCLRAQVLCLRAYLFLRGAYAGLHAPQFCLRHTLTRGPLLNMNTRV